MSPIPPEHIFALIQIAQGFIGMGGVRSLTSAFRRNRPADAVAAIRALAPAIEEARQLGVIAEADLGSVKLRPASLSERGATPESGTPHELTTGNSTESPGSFVDVNSADDIELAGRAAESLAREQLRRQLNRELVVAEAVAAFDESSSGAPPVPEIDQDWLARFFAFASELSSERAQRLWGRVLAGEATRPGRFSLRTLDALRVMSQVEAELVEKAARFRIVPFSPSLDPVVGFGCIPYGEEHGSPLTFSELEQLRGIGVLAPNEGGTRTEIPAGQFHLWEYGNHAVVFFAGEDDTFVMSRANVFTRLGAELSGLVRPDMDLEFAQSLIALSGPGIARVVVAPVVGRGRNEDGVDELLVDFDKGEVLWERLK